MAPTSNHATYAERLLTDLDDIETAYKQILSSSGIKNVDPNRTGSAVVFIAAAQWGWEASNTELEAARMALLGKVRDWGPRARLLFPHPTPSVRKRLDHNLKRLGQWLLRNKGSRSVPPTIAQAQRMITENISSLRELFDLLPHDEYPVRMVVDTNALMDNPHLPAYKTHIGDKYVVHLLPVVLREIDELKRAGRNEEVREAARRAERRLKGIRTNGDVIAGRAGRRRSLCKV